MKCSGKDKELQYQSVFDNNYIKYDYQVKYEICSFNNCISKICDFILFIDDRRYCLEIKHQDSTGSTIEKIGGFTDYFIYDYNSRNDILPFDEIIIVVSGCELIDKNDDMILSKTVEPFKNAIAHKNLILPIDIITEQNLYSKFNLSRTRPRKSIEEIAIEYEQKLTTKNQLELF